MKFFFISLFITLNSFALESLLITGFDPFDGASENNSRVIGKELQIELANKFPHLEIKFCELRTVYHKATEMVIDCAHSMSKSPDLIISMGESGCNPPKLETRARNYLKDYSQDNDGVHYRGMPIENNEPKYFSTQINWNKAYCELSQASKNYMQISKDAGTFVCNETMYNISKLYSEFNFGFIHVPTANCRNNKNNLMNAKASIKNLLINFINNPTLEKYQYPQTKRQAKRALRNAQSSCEEEALNKLLRSY